MKAAVMNFIKGCEICQQNKHSTLQPAGLLQPLPIPSNVWVDISMDFIGELPKANGMDTIFVVVDHMTKYARFFPLSHPFTAKDVAVLFIKEVVRLHGFPSSIVEFWYHMTKQWPAWLSWAEFWYNTSYHGSIRMTPFRALYGREPPALLRGGMESSVEEVRVLLEERNQMLDEIQFQLNRAQNRMRQSADKKRRDVSFEVGDFVYLKLQLYRMKSLAARSN
ncbi:uncharacterized protein [Arachis hypogaea]|uniref:uncharacterized protein n=1 Tax=Arachis hypogaea TaxID=3818 RepID=UPI003B223652